MLCFGAIAMAFPLDFHFRHITSENGLPHQQVEALAQDADTRAMLETIAGEEDKHLSSLQKQAQSASH